MQDHDYEHYRKYNTNPMVHSTFRVDVLPCRPHKIFLSPMCALVWYLE